MTSAQHNLRITLPHLLLRLLLSFLLQPLCNFFGLSPQTHHLLPLPKPLLGDFPLKLLLNPQVPLPFPSHSHLSLQHSHRLGMGHLKSSRVSQQDTRQISHLPLCQSSTASPPKTSPSLPLPPPLLSPLRPLPPLWSNRLSISSQETLPLTPTWRDPRLLLRSHLQQLRPNQSGNLEVLWLHSPQSSPHLLLMAP